MKKVTIEIDLTNDPFFPYPEEEVAYVLLLLSRKFERMDRPIALLAEKDDVIALLDEKDNVVARITYE